MKSFDFNSLALVGALTFAALPALAGETPPAAETERRPAAIGGSVYDKPFLFRAGGQLAVGGYMDIEFNADEKGSTFDAHRFVPFLYGNVSERVTVASEIEFEHGGAVAGDEETDGEISLEYAHVDFRAAEWLIARGGVLLSPLGRFNLSHDSPTNDLTLRPLVDTQIVPTTLSESGMGFYGQFYPGAGTMTYEVYLVNGFNDEIWRGDDLRIRGGRGSRKSDNNNARSLVGRFGFSPALGVGLGASIHTGRYSGRSEPAADLTITSFDGVYTRGRLELMGELAFASADTPSGQGHARRQNGFYGQANYHFLTDAVKTLPGSTFTGVIRFDQVDYDTDKAGDRERRLTVGVNFRPTEQTAFKLDVSRQWLAAPGSDGDRPGFDSSHFSLATYF